MYITEIISRSFHVESDKRQLQLITMWYAAVTFAINGFIYLAIILKWVHISRNNITRYCYKKLQNDEMPWYCKICLGQAMPFSNHTGNQLEAFMFG